MRGPVVLMVSDMLPKRCAGPLREQQAWFVSEELAWHATEVVRSLRAGLSGKRWHSYLQASAS